jgi:penicillin amidase
MINGHSLNPDEAKAFNELRNWKYDHDARAVSPQIFEYWWRQIHLNIWRDDLRQEGLLQPKAEITLRMLLADQRSPFIDNRDTPGIESLGDIVRQSFSEAVRQMTTDFGPLGSNWSWGTTRGTPIRHLGQIPGLGLPKLETAGNYNSVNAITQGGGPSWRMVVELGPTPKGWGVYPGGQSGNPGSAYYDSFVEAWLQGEYYELVFLNAPEEKNDHVVAATTLKVVK